VTPAATTGGYSPGSVLGDILHSDIVAYINGHAIPTSIGDGMTLVAAEDLRNYGFDVNWNGATRSLHIERNASLPFSPLPVQTSTQPVGTFKQHYFHTDIRTYISGVLVESFAVEGETLLNFELLARYGNLTWDGAARALRLTLNAQ
jgi:hypothetical protein